MAIIKFVLFLGGETYDAIRNRNLSGVDVEFTKSEFFVCQEHKLLKDFSKKFSKQLFEFANKGIFNEMSSNCTQQN